MILTTQVSARAAADRLVKLDDLSDGDRAGYTGVYAVNGAKSSGECFLTLTADPVTGGYAVKVPPVCVKAFPELATVTVWRLHPNDDIDLVGTSQTLRLRHRSPEGEYHLRPGTTGVATVRWAGQWDVAD